MSNLDGRADNITGISITFLVGDEVVPVPVLNSILQSTQQAIYAVGAYNTGRDRLRGEVRRQYTLAVASIHHSDLYLHLVPLTTLLIEQLPLFGTIATGLATNLLYDAAKVALLKMKDHYAGKLPAIVVTPDDTEESAQAILEHRIWQTSCQHAEAVAALGHPVRTLMRTPDGLEVEFEANPNEARRIIEQNAEMRSQVRRFRDCELISISIPGPTLRARIPAYGNSEIRCDCQIPVTTIAETRLHLHRRYAIVGAAVWDPGRHYQKRPTKIEVTTIEDVTGEVILMSVRDADVRPDENEDNDLDLFQSDGDDYTDDLQPIRES